MKIGQIRWKIILFVVIVLFLTPSIVTAVFVNWGSILHWRSAKGFQAQKDGYPYWREQPDAQLAQMALNTYRKAYQFNPSNEVVRWGLGRAALAVGDYSEAAQVLSSDPALLRGNPPRYIDTIVSYSLVGNDEQVLRTYTQIPPTVSSQVISDTIAIAYMRQLQAKMFSASKDETIEILRKVVSLRPNDLFANYYLWAILSQPGQTSDADTYRQHILQTPAVMDVGTDHRLLGLACEVFPELIKDNLWGKERGKSVLAYWVWKQPAEPGLKVMLDKLAGQEPDEPAWSFYLGELYQRVGQNQLASQYYQKALASGTEQYPAQRRLDELQGDSHLGTINDAEEDVALVAGIFGLLPGQVQLGEKLVDTSEFITTAGNIYEGWSYFTYSGRLNWQFTTGRDDLERPGSLRMENLWWPERDAGPPYVPHAGYRSPNIPVNGSWLMVSLRFRVTGAPNPSLANVLIGTNTANWRPFFAEVGFPDTGDQWKRLLIVGRVPDESKELFIMPKIVYGSHLWLADVQVRPVQVNGTPTQCVDKPCVQFINNIVKSE